MSCGRRFELFWPMLRPDPYVSIEQKFHSSLGLPAVKGADGFHNFAADFDSASHRSEPRTLLLRARRHDLGYGSPKPRDSDRRARAPDVFITARQVALNFEMAISRIFR